MKLSIFSTVFCISLVVTFGDQISPNSTPDLSEADEIRPFSSPLDEFDRIEKECEHKGVQGFDAAREDHQNCLKSKENKADEVGQSCNDGVRGNSACWVGITQKIEECLPGRGKTVESIHTAFRLEFYCNPNFTAELSKLETSGKLCSAELKKTEACKDVVGMTSADLCTSFSAQKLCEESNLASCPYDEHIGLLRNGLNAIGKLLGCKTETETAHPEGHQPVVSKSPKTPILSILPILILARIVL